MKFIVEIPGDLRELASTFDALNHAIQYTSDGRSAVVLRRLYTALSNRTAVATEAPDKQLDEAILAMMARLVVELSLHEHMDRFSRLVACVRQALDADAYPLTRAFLDIVFPKK